MEDNGLSGVQKSDKKLKNLLDKTAESLQGLNLL
jgi:hypothetical protein